MCMMYYSDSVSPGFMNIVHKPIFGRFGSCAASVCLLWQLFSVDHHSLTSVWRDLGNRTGIVVKHCRHVSLSRVRRLRLALPRYDSNLCLDYYPASHYSFLSVSLKPVCHLFPCSAGSLSTCPHLLLKKYK